MCFTNTGSRITCLMMCLIVLTTGCSQQDFTRPFFSPITDFALSKDPQIESTRKKRDLDRSRKFDDALANWQQLSVDGKPSYHIGIEDIVQLEIISMEIVGKPSTLLRTVDNSGMINLSWAGNVEVAGLTVQEAEAAVIKHLSGGYINNPNVTLKVAEFRSAGVAVTGAVTKPGVYYLESDRRSLLEVLSLAGGLDTRSSDELFLIRGKQSLAAQGADKDSITNSMIVVNLALLVDKGDLRANLWVQKGDMITVRPREKQYVSVLGYVNRPGSFDIGENTKMTAMEALGLAGGLTSTARAENSWLLRMTPEGQKTVQLDITAMASGTMAPLHLEAGDTLFVGSSAFAKLAEFITPSVSAGASYSPVP